MSTDSATGADEMKYGRSVLLNGKRVDPSNVYISQNGDICIVVDSNPHGLSDPEMVAWEKMQGGRNDG